MTGDPNNTSTRIDSDLLGSAGTITDYQHADMAAQLKDNPLLGKIQQASMNRRCIYCKENVYGIDDEALNKNPMREHLETCQVRKEIKEKRAKASNAIMVIDSSAKELDVLVKKQREVYRAIKASIKNIIDTNLQFGSDLPCFEDIEYNTKYDFGRANTIKCAVVNGYGGLGGRPQEELMVKLWVTDPVDGEEYHPREAITRVCDDQLMAIRRKYPQLYQTVLLEIADEQERRGGK